jgi:hypothetical protein
MTPVPIVGELYLQRYTGVAFVVIWLDDSHACVHNSGQHSFRYPVRMFARNFMPLLVPLTMVRAPGKR